MVEVVSPPGDQRYAPPPTDGVATIVTAVPAQIVSSLTATVGPGVTVMVPISLLLGQPFNVYTTV